MGSSLKTLSSLQGRVALVTGAAGHLGQTIVEVLAELGASVFMLDKDKDKLSLFAQQFSEKYPQKIWPILFDLELKDAPEQILKLVI